MKTIDLKKALRKNFVKEMKNANYEKNSDFSWTKNSIGPYVFTIQIFPNNTGGYCWIEAGVHLDFIPLNHNGMRPELKKIKTISSMMRMHLKNKLNDKTNFIYGDDEGSMALICDYLLWAVKDDAENIFSFFNNYPEPFSAIKLDDIKSGKSYSPIPFGNNILEALEISRIKLFLEKKQEAVEFADYGLSLIEGLRGSALIPQFENLKKGELYL